MPDSFDEAAAAHARLLKALEDQYNRASPKQQEAMQRTLVLTRAKAAGSVRGLRTLFPALTGKLVVKEDPPMTDKAPHTPDESHDA